MSGGHFDYQQYNLSDIVDSIQRLIDNNNVTDEYGHASNYREKTLEEFKTAIAFLKKAEVYAQRIDWLVSGDDGEEIFHERLKEDLNKCKKDVIIDNSDLDIITTSFRK